MIDLSKTAQTARGQVQRDQGAICPKWIRGLLVPNPACKTRGREHRNVEHPGDGAVQEVYHQLFRSCCAHPGPVIVEQGILQRARGQVRSRA